MCAWRLPVCCVMTVIMVLVCVYKGGVLAASEARSVTAACHGVDVRKHKEALHRL
jgi:hypothetical protein